MAKLRLVARHEFLKSVRRRAFLLSTLGIPLFIVVVIGVAILTTLGGNDQALGYVDHAGVLSAGIRPEMEEEVEIRPFADEPSARAALEGGEIQAFFVLPPDYLESRKVSLIYWDEAPGERVRDAFDAFLQASLLADLEPQVRQRIIKGPEIIIRSADGQREIGQNNWVAILLPFFAGFFFVFAVMMSAGYLLQVVTDEKENRTIEIMVTSLSPEQLIGGKALGLMAVALAQLLIWAITLVLGLIVGAAFRPELANIGVPWAFLALTVLYFLPAYALIAGMMTAIGGIVSETRQAQQIAGVLNLLFVLPYFFVALIVADPNSPILVALTLFPTTAFVTITVRWGLAGVPTWQLITSWILLAGAAAFSVWAASRIFRAGMLHYGQPLNLRTALQAVRGQ